MLKKLLIGMVIGLSLICFSKLTVIAAQDKVADVGTPKISWLEQMKYGDTIGNVIVFLTFLGLGFVIEHAITIRRKKMLPPVLLAKLKSHFDKEEYKEALELCKREECFLTNVVGAGLSRLGSGFDQMQAAMQEAREGISLKLRHKVDYLLLIAIVAPMLGLLGVVKGMIMACWQIGIIGTVTQAQIATSIAMALVLIFEALVLSIPAAIMYILFRNRVTALIFQAGVVTDNLMERFRNPKHER